MPSAARKQQSSPSARLALAAVVVVQVATLSLHDALPILVPLASRLPLRLRSNVPSVVIAGLFGVPLSTRLVKASVPAVGAVLSTTTSMTLLVEELKSTRLNSSHGSKSYAVCCS